MPDDVATLANNFIARVVERGNSISWVMARNTVVAAIYLRARDILLIPDSAEQARKLDAEELRQCRALCTGWKEWADTATSRVRCERTIAMLIAVEQEAEFKRRRAPEPIGGYSSDRRGSLYTKAQWWEAA